MSRRGVASPGAPGSAPDGADPAVGEIVARVRDELDDLVPRMGATYRHEIPLYAELSPRTMEEEVLRTSRRFVEEFLTRTATGEGVENVDLSPMRQAGRRRLRMGISLDAALHAFRIAGRVAWDAVVAATRTGEEPALVALAGQWIDYVDRASSEFAEGYLAASHDQLRRLDARRSAIVEALLEASETAEVAAVEARYAVSLARAYTPVVLAGEDVSVRIDLVVGAAPADTLAGLRGDRVLLLVPGDGASPHELGRTARASLVAHGDPVAPGPALVSEVRHTEALLLAAMRAGHEQGVFGPGDLLLDQLVAADTHVADLLRRRVLDPLAAADPNGIFLTTLRRYLDGGSIPDTAASEVVHPNTVAYRLRRVAEITGLDPRIPTDAALLVAALTSGGHQ